LGRLLRRPDQRPRLDQPAADRAQLIAGIQQLITLAHQNGISFICSTLTPYQGSYYWNQSGETAREAVDAWVRTPGNGCDGVIDQDDATHNPSAPTSTCRPTTAATTCTRATRATRPSATR
jgi:hypothetical protein